MSPIQMTLSEARAALAKKEVSGLELLDLTLQRVDEVNPRLNAFPRINPEAARARARALDAALTWLRQPPAIAGVSQACEYVCSASESQREAKAVAMVLAAPPASQISGLYSGLRPICKGKWDVSLSRGPSATSRRLRINVLKEPYDLLAKRKHAAIPS